MDKYWNDFKISHKGINYCEDGEYFLLLTSIVDSKTNYEIVEIYTTLEGKYLEFHIGTNEKMVKRLKLPSYKHYASFSYMEGKKYFDQKRKKGRNILCLSLGPSNIGKVIKSILSYWTDQGHYVKRIGVERETGATTAKEMRYYEVKRDQLCSEIIK